MFGSGFRIALGSFKVLWRSSKWRQACLTTHRFAEKYVDKAIAYRRKLESEDSTHTAGEGMGRYQNLLYNMAEQTEDRTELRNEILQAVMAAQETTAVFFMLSRHPSVWNKLRHEALSLTEDQLEMDVLLNLKYLRNVVNETLRLYPVFPQMNRVALRDTVLPVSGGPDQKSPIYVRKGTVFDTAFYVLHRQQDIWGKDAEAFKPDRWDTFRPDIWEYQPFGAGPRGCVG
ncbi:MAG: hypothetical protein Q9170_004733 [Blastenia crenularia]